VLAIALNFCLLHAIGLGAIHAAVRLRSYDCASAGRIGALSLTLSVHLFTSRRAGSPPKELCTTKATSPLDGNPIEDRRSFAQSQKSLSPNGVTTVNPIKSVRRHRADDSLHSAKCRGSGQLRSSKGLIQGRFKILAADPTHTKTLGAPGPTLRSSRPGMLAAQQTIESEVAGSSRGRSSHRWMVHCHSALTRQPSTQNTAMAR